MTDDRKEISDFFIFSIFLICRMVCILVYKVQLFSLFAWVLQYKNCTHSDNLFHSRPSSRELVSVHLSWLE